MFLHVLTLVAVCAALLLAYVFVSYQRNIVRAKHLPGDHQPLPYFSTMCNLLPMNNINPHRSGLYKHLPEYFQQINGGVWTLTTYNNHLVFVNDADLIKEMTMVRPNEFLKPVFIYSTLKFYGENIVTAADGDEWKKHRLLCNPAFSNKNYAYVHATTIKIIKDMIAHWPRQNDQSVLADTDTDMVGVTLGIIASAGFGQDLHVFKPGEKDFDHSKYRHSIKSALETVSNYLILRIITPSFVWKYPFGRTAEIASAFTDFEKHMHEIIEKKSHEYQRNEPEREDLLSLLLKANNAESSEHLKLSQSELVGDTFAFLLAGHETTANTLTFALRLLALHPEIQEKAYQEIVRLLPNGGDPTYAEIGRFDYMRAIFKETLRLYPAVVSIPKYTPNETELGGLQIPAGSIVHISTWSLHRNPKYWSDAEKFMPERFLDTSQMHHFAYVPFSAGSRSCIGMKFSQVEGVTALVCMLRDFTIDVPPEMEKWSYEKQEGFLLDTHTLLTLKPKNKCHLRFRPRS